MRERKPCPGKFNLEEFEASGSCLANLLHVTQYAPDKTEAQIE